MKTEVVLKSDEQIIQMREECTFNENRGCIEITAAQVAGMLAS